MGTFGYRAQVWYNKDEKTLNYKYRRTGDFLHKGGGHQDTCTVSMAGGGIEVAKQLWPVVPHTVWVHEDTFWLFSSSISQSFTFIFHED
jgi:hypothetical protein